MTVKTDTPLEDMSFESALAELENIVRRLESGDIPLEDAIKAYERGRQLKGHCEKRLSAARMRVEQVTLDSDGAPSLTPAAPDAG